MLLAKTTSENSLLIGKLAINRKKTYTTQICRIWVLTNGDNCHIAISNNNHSNIDQLQGYKVHSEKEYSKIETI